MSYKDPIPMPTPVPVPPWPSSPYKLEAVVVCSQYGDFLRHTLPQNKHLFNKLVVVTDYEDKETRKKCEFYHVECIPTDRLNTRKGEFCKGAGINEGLAALDKDGWVVHLDGDIWLPPLTRILLENADLDPARIYGIDRFIVKGPEAWERFLEMPLLQHEDNVFVHLNAFPLGVRIAQEHLHGYVPIGFFQMWNPKVSGISTYPEGHTTAAREDGQFAAQWPRYSRELLAEVVGYHLESADAVMSLNWAGRKSARFSLLDQKG